MSFESLSDRELLVLVAKQNKALISLLSDKGIKAAKPETKTKKAMRKSLTTIEKQFNQQ